MAARGYGNASRRLTTCAATTNLTSAVAAPCDLYQIICTNTSASVKFLKLYNKASAPVLASDVPVLTIALPATAITNIPMPMGLYFSAGLAFAMTGADGDTDATAMTAGDLKGLNLVVGI
jgi:hypothetical protein